ncbi:MAG TPA: Arm DNA-binding domain-containing protein [Roseiarcus sp.]|nr:Arm DNA-binding domain-containing protein [Roseiarcus sp.]
MTRVLNKLSASKVATAKGPASLSDGGHLTLLAGPNQSKRWIFRFSRNGKEREISLGTFPAVSLADARRKQDQLNAALAEDEPLTGPRRGTVKPFEPLQNK